MVSVGFRDGKMYIGKKLDMTENTIQVEFLHTHSVYEFDKNGNILSSTGSYLVGDKVNIIDVSKYKKSRYSDTELNIEPGRTVGITFNDGQVYFGNIESISENSFSISFLHTGSNYEMLKDNGIWIVNWTDKGTYALGTKLLDIFELNDGEFFYVKQ